MKVLWFSHLVPYPETGLGVLQRSYHLVRELARAHQVYLLAFVQRRIIEELLGDVDAGLEKAREHLEQYCARVQFLSISLREIGAGADGARRAQPRGWLSLHYPFYSTHLLRTSA